MKIPLDVAADVEAALEDATGKVIRIRKSAPVGGGCINPSARLETDTGEAFFLKWNDSAAVEMFAAEADGLQALSAPGFLRVPEVVAWGGNGSGSDPGWLLLEFIHRGPTAPDYGFRMGVGLAQLHASPISTEPSLPFSGSMSPAPGCGQEDASFGWHRDNYIGSLPQANGAMQSWSEFWRDRRIGPQLRLAKERGYFRGEAGRSLDKLQDRIEGIIPELEQHVPALLHGDLWSGNYFPDGNGSPVIIDPATYRGDGEVDLAMMELFGAFPEGFRRGYQEVLPIGPEYSAFRRDLYQLYYLLVHVNLFGGSYVAGCNSAVNKVLAAT